MALNTVADYIARARTLLQDLVPPYRYLDDDLISNLNEGIQVSRGIRPDLWLSFFRTSLPTYSAGSPTTPVVIDPIFVSAFVYYMAGLSQLSDQEDTTDARATAFLGKFASMLTGVGA
jgi:hypothetical protein